MVLSKIYIIPHGDEIIERKNPEAEKMNALITALAAQETAETMVVLSPHGIRISDSVGVINTSYLHGDLVIGGHRIRRNFSVDRILADKISASVPGFTRSVSFITSSGPKSVFPLDFGSLIPVSFFGPESMVAIGQPRISNRERLWEFGRTLYSIVESHSNTVSVIFSADQAHTHSREGPYGFSELATEYEGKVKRAIETNSFDTLMKIPQSMIDSAKPDSFWNMIILGGFIQESKLRMHLDFGYVEHYFGMILAHST